MAKLSNNNKSHTSNNHYSGVDAASARGHIRATCYAVDAVTMAVQGQHYSTTLTGGMSSALSYIDISVTNNL